MSSPAPIGWPSLEELRRGSRFAIAAAIITFLALELAASLSRARG